MSNAGSRENRQVNLETWRSLGRVTEKSEFAVLGRGRNPDRRGSRRDWEEEKMSSSSIIVIIDLGPNLK